MTSTPATVPAIPQWQWRPRQGGSAWAAPTNKPSFLLEGDDDAKRQAIAIVHRLGAAAVYEKMKLEMRSEGIRSIPRGSRKTTRETPPCSPNANSASSNS